MCQGFHSLAPSSVTGLPYTAMASATQNTYQCEHCGTTDIVAMPLVYQQGTRSYASRSGWGWGTSQSISAEHASPPKGRSVIRPLLIWGFAIFFFAFWGIAGMNAATRFVKTADLDAAIVLFCLGATCFICLIFNLRRVSRYNRTVLPRLLWNWEHTYLCRRCGSSRLIG